MLRLSIGENLKRVLKRYVIIIIITIVAIVAGVVFLVAAYSTSAEDLRLDFDRLWSEKMSDNEDLAFETVKRLETYLQRRPWIRTDDISNISEHLFVHTTGGLKIIEFTENPEIYGDSKKRSFHIFMFGSKVKLLLAGDSISIYRLVKSSDNVFIVFANDYHVEGQTGLRLFKIVTYGSDIYLLYNIIDKKAPTDFEFIGESLYYKDSHVYVDKTSADGRLIGIVAEDNSGHERFFELKLLF